MVKRLREEVMHWGSPVSHTKSDASDPTQQTTFTHRSPSYSIFFCSPSCLLTHDVSKPPSLRDCQRTCIFSCRWRPLHLPHPRKCHRPVVQLSQHVSFVAPNAFALCYWANELAQSDCKVIQAWVNVTRPLLPQWWCACKPTSEEPEPSVMSDWPTPSEASVHRKLSLYAAAERLGICMLELWASMLWFWKKWTCILG